ncbi:MAG: APC family permease [SAR202 cluster bacterium]|nr:APC family permease [SAR202 cluster bacterium]
MLNALRHLVFGYPLATSQSAIQRLAVPLAFVILSANPLSSSAYASEEILIAFGDTGARGLTYALFVSLAIVALYFIVVFSYQQVVRVYTGGGGSYTVAKTNLGVPWGLIAGAGLLIDYVLTVAVSVSAGVAALASAFPEFADHKVSVSIALILGLTVLNLRGVRESAFAFALPVYLFIICLIVMTGIGVFRYLVHGTPATVDINQVSQTSGAIGILLLLRAFAAGCVALTGIESVSNATTIFKAPVSHNARVTLLMLGVIMAALFMGISLLTYLFDIGHSDSETLVSQVAKASLGVNIFYYIVLTSTTLILLLAANTAFADFPRLSAIMARDGYLPRPLANLGDRLVYFNGILTLAFFSVILIILSNANTHSLIPLYAIGVFVGFTLTQSGMVSYWLKNREKGWRSGLIINGIGAIVTGVVLVEITVVKFAPGTWVGAWIIVLVIFLLILLFYAIRNHYTAVADALSLERETSLERMTGIIAIVPIGAVHRAVLPAIDYARSIAADVRAVHVTVDEVAAQSVRDRWSRISQGLNLIFLPSPYRAVVSPLVQYIHKVAEESPHQRVVVVIPEFVPRRWWQQFLHNQTALFIKGALLFQRHIIVVSVPYHLPR